MKSNKKQWNVLIFPGGTEIGLEIGKSLGMCKEVKMISASSIGYNHSSFFFEKNYIVDNVLGSTLFIEQLNNIIEEEQIDYLIPANPLVIDKILDFRNEINCKVLLSHSEIVRITRSKHHTYDLLNGVIPLPETFYNLESIAKWPVHIKPNNSYGSQGTFVAESKEEVLRRYKVLEDLVIQENLTGAEYTVDCFSDSKGRLLYAGPRIRERIRMGTTMHSYVPEEAIKNELLSYANRISEKLPLTGIWFFQVKADSKGSLKLLEVEARMAGTMCFNRVKGVNFPLLNIFQDAGYELGLLVNNYEVVLDRALINRYKVNIDYDSVYVDLDDTIIVNNKVNLMVVKFLYQCLNNEKKIILISKSIEVDKAAYLEKFKLRQLFDEVIWLNENESKADCIIDKKSIFIDDSFSQRNEVYKKKGIYTFDTSMVELLINDKI
jgi:predicted ATP-grasp superfamily ATP-dependent carboligase